MCTYVKMCVNAVGNNVVLPLCLGHDVCNIFLKIKHVIFFLFFSQFYRPSW